MTRLVAIVWYATLNCNMFNRIINSFETNSTEKTSHLKQAEFNNKDRFTSSQKYFSILLDVLTVPNVIFVFTIHSFILECYIHYHLNKIVKKKFSNPPNFNLNLTYIHIIFARHVSSKNVCNN